MKRIFTLWLTAISVASFAQTDCSNGRYSTYNYFSDVEVTSGVIFGSNTAVNGSQTTLRMDIYEPAGDTETERPVVIIAFGGSFIGGARTDGSVVSLCNMFARMGYVAVAPDYRVGFFFPINQVTTTLAVMRSMHDLKACIRNLRKTVAEDSNPYGIDADKIIAGGISAGAIGAIHTAYLDQLEEIPSYMSSDTAGLGGVEGISGTPGYSSAPFAVLSMSGTIGDSSWINIGDVPICSIHEENDGTVPYLTTEVAVSGFPTGLIASGSGDLHKRAENVGIDNCVLTYRGVANHVGYLGDQEALDFARDFCANMVCDGGSDCGSVDAGATSNVAEVEQNSITVFPNPTAGTLNFSADAVLNVEIIDVLGKVVFTDVSQIGRNQLDLNALPTGAYTLRTIGKQIGTAHFVKE